MHARPSGWCPQLTASVAIRTLASPGWNREGQCEMYICTQTFIVGKSCHSGKKVSNHYLSRVEKAKAIAGYHYASRNACLSIPPPCLPTCPFSCIMYDNTNGESQRT
jgi:hypothetical protein